MNSATGIESLIGNAAAFPVLDHWHFFNHAGVAPLSHTAGEAIRKYAAQAEADVYLYTNWYTDVERLRQLAASIVNAHRDEIALVKNTSDGISIVANGLEWGAGDVIVTTAVEYPANVYPWMEVARRHGVKLVMVAEETDKTGARAVPTEKILAAASDPRCKLLALSHVEFASGQRHDIATIGAWCRERGILFCVDAIQAIGVVPVDVQAMSIDYLSADGHKWMMGPEGAGFFFIRRELIEQTRPTQIGWLNVVNAEQYGTYDFTLKPDAGRYECGTYNIPGCLGLKAALELLLHVGIDAIATRVKVLTDHLVDRLTAKGYQVLSPRSGEQWSGIASFASRTHSHEQMVRTLRKEHWTEIALREGRLRASPHFYNTEAQMDRLVELLPGHGQDGNL